MNEQDKRRAEFVAWMRANYGIENLWRNPCKLPPSDFIWQGWNAALDQQKKHVMNGLKPEIIICSECGAAWRIGKEESPCEHLSNLREQIKTDCRDWVRKN